LASPLPKQIASYFDPLRNGIKAAANAAMAINIELHFHSYPGLGKGRHRDHGSEPLGCTSIG
jgi:LacI family transcriptional regulator